MVDSSHRALTAPIFIFYFLNEFCDFTGFMALEVVQSPNHGSFIIINLLFLLKLIF